MGGDAEKLHRECTRLVGSNRHVVDEVQCRLFATEPRSRTRNSRGCLTVALERILCICLGDQKVA